MKKATLLLLALTAATPALAQNAHDDRDGGHHDDGGKHEQARPAGRNDNHAARPDQGRANGGGDRGPHNERQPGRPGASQYEPNRGGDQRHVDRDAGAAPALNRDRNDRPGQWNGHNNGRAPDGQPGWDRRNDGGRPDDHRAQTWQTDRAPGWHPEERSGSRNDGYRGGGYRGDDRRGYDDRADRGGWNRGWRTDPRYNWQGYRRYNAQRFHAPRYFAPRGYGYGYRQWSPGLRVEPFFYGRNYWIQDFYDYRLPPPPPGAQWVRYYNDVALINVYDGTVLDVIQGFFY